MTIRPLIAASLTLPLLAGCADTRSGYPSLAPRPIERAALKAAPAPATAPVDTPAISPTADLAQIVASAQAADSAFKAALEKARPQIEAARGAAEGSEAWVMGQQAFSSADAERAPVSQALAELDKRREAAIDAGNHNEEATIAKTAQQVQALDEAERAQLEAAMPS